MGNPGMTGLGTRRSLSLPESGAASGRYSFPMHVDVMTVPQPLSRAADLARRTGRRLLRPAVHRDRYDRLPQRRRRLADRPGLELSTGVAVALPRSPFVTAAAAWELQEATGGNFRLGLGTQVRRHVERRYGAAFDRPGPRLREYVRAVKACFEAFRSGKLDHHGDFYDLDFITPQWSPGPIDVADPKVDVAAVNPWMLRMAGEVADGVHVHPIGEPGYLNRHVLPRLPRARRRRDARRRTSR